MSDPWGEKLERLDLTRRHYHNNDYLAFLVDSVWKLKASGRDFHIVSPLVMMDAALVRWGRPGRLRDALRTWQAITVDYAVLQIIAELRARGIYCALATNQNACRARYMSEHLGYATTFDHAFYSCAIGFTKPDPRFFRTVLERLRLPPYHVLFIDDREENVAAARACGMEGMGAVMWLDTGCRSGA